MSVLLHAVWAFVVIAPYDVPDFIDTGPAVYAAPAVRRYSDGGACIKIILFSKNSQIRKHIHYLDELIQLLLNRHNL